MHPLDLAPFAPRLAASLGAALLTWWASVSAGDYVLYRIGFAQDHRLRWPFAAAIGYALLGSVAALVALAHLAYVPVLVLIPVASLALYWRWAFLEVPQALSASLRHARETPAIDRFALIVAGAAVITSIIAAALPAVWWDPIAYHLPIVAQALATHTLGFDPAMTQTAFPALAECAALPAYAIAGSSGAAMSTLGTGIALAWLCGALASAFEPRAYALTVALVTSCPLWLWLAPSFYVDVPFALFAVGAFALTLAAGLVEPIADAALFSGLLAGSAAAVKYTGIIIGVMAFIAVLVAAKQRRTNAALAFLGGFVAVAGGWYVRSLLLTHDPLYPFLSTSPASPIHEFARRYVDMTGQWCGGPATLSGLLQLPWMMLVDPRQYCGDPGYALRLGAVVFVAGLAAWRSTWRPVLLSAVLTFAWYFESRQDRFVIPALCVFTIAVAVSLVQLPMRDGVRAGIFGALCALGAVAVVASWTPSLIGVSANSLVPSLRFIAGEEGADELLPDRLETYDATVWVSRHLEPGERVLAVDDVRDYYLGGAAAWANPYYQPVWAVDWSAPPRERYARFAAAGFRYAIVNLNRAYLERTPASVDPAVMKRDVAAGVVREVYHSDDVVVLELPVPRP